ncbi:MAG: alpha/beta hydrolase [Deltaproteobacteria bacterium]|nr:alpha/beta hydrolase [Deltaproteobacteria bacterium]NNK84483.1 alpha/beta hydrolase [Desulfobacterales bacterium]
MKMILSVIKWAMFCLAGLLLFLVVCLQAYKVVLKKMTNINTPSGVSSLEKITLGGLNQWIFIRGTDQSNPVLIFLHGGPGAPLGSISSSRKYDAKLIKHFTLVHWDQRGAGKSYHPDISLSSMTIDRLVEDCNELIEYLRNRFDTQKVFIVAHSSGSVIGIKTAHKYPDKIHAYIGVCQIINEYEQQKISYNYIVEEAKKSGDAKTIDKIKAIGPPPYDTLQRQNDKDNYIFRYGGVVHKKAFQHIGAVMLGFLTSPEYSLLEGFKTLMNKGYEFSMNAMWQEIKNINLTKEIQSIKVPIYFFEGRYDMATPTVLVEKFYNGLDAEKGKEFIVFENSAHIPMLEEKKKYEDLLVNLVKRKAA